MATVSLSRLTNAQKSAPPAGTGIFDELMEQVNNHIDYQFNKGRLTGPDYAQVYLGALQSTISESIKFLLQEQVIARQADLIDAQIESEAVKQKLMKAQTLGFKSDTKQKLLKQMLDGYAVNLSLSTVVPVIPATVQEATIDQLSQEMLTELGSSVVVQSTTQVPAVS
jgi:uncharacterized protein with ATP-grasp and redox domains